MSDIEKNSIDVASEPVKDTSGLARGTGTLARISQKIESFGVEGRGIERMQEYERTDKRLIDNMWIWGSANMTLVTFSVGCLGPIVFGLGLRDSIATIIVFNFLGALAPAYFSTFGPPMGLRQMTISRYSFGWIGTCIMATLNILACMGWSAVNTIVGAQTLRVVSNNSLNLIGGIIIISLISLVIGLFGYKIVHIYERYAWFPVAITFLILLGKGAHSFTDLPAASGPIEAASVLSFGGTIYGFATGWTSYAADYNVRSPSNSSRLRVFIYTYFGLLFPLILVQLLGLAYVSGFPNEPTWEAGYNDNSVGGLVGAGLASLGGFGKFLLVLLALSIVANNIPNLYSLGLSAQVYGSWSQKYIPRYLWTLVGTAVYIILAILGRDSFFSTLQTLLNVIGYWLAIYAVILTEEHLIFRKNSFANYDLNAWDTYSALPHGLAAIGASCFGVAGAVVGMSQIWYVGPIAKMIGDPMFGGDIGFELSFAFAGITYPVFRYFELKKFGR